MEFLLLLAWGGACIAFLTLLIHSVSEVFGKSGFSVFMRLLSLVRGALLVAQGGCFLYYFDGETSLNTVIWLFVANIAALLFSKLYLSWQGLMWGGYFWFVLKMYAVLGALQWAILCLW